MSNGKKIFKYLICALVTAAVCILLLTLACCIPSSAIEKGVRGSADYLSTRDPFKTMYGGLLNSTQDNYSDAVLVNIAYNVDSEKPLLSVLKAEYYLNDSNSQWNSILEMLSDDSITPNEEYARYWHGSLIYIRPLLAVMDLYGVRILVGLIVTLSSIYIVVKLWKKNMKDVALIYVIVLCLIHFWMSFASLENGNCLMVMSLGTAIFLSLPKKDESTCFCYFLSIGIVTYFMDFLTVETLPLTIPMCLWLIEKGREAGTDATCRRKGLIFFIKGTLMFLAGYVGMFLGKLLVIGVTMGGETLRSSVAEGLFRSSGAATGVYTIDGQLEIVVASGFKMYYAAIWRNFAMLFPLTQATNGSLPITLTLIIIAICSLMVYLFHEKDKKNYIYPILWFTAFIPLGRYLILANHACVHYFFTYRALMPFLLVLILWTKDNCGLLTRRISRTI